MKTLCHDDGKSPVSPQDVLDSLYHCLGNAQYCGLEFYHDSVRAYRSGPGWT